MTALRRMLAVAAIAIAAGLGAAGDAFAGHVQCGDTITTDTTLDSDLLDCPGNGVVIGAPNITLDLGGHVIDGPDPPPLFLADFPPDGVSDRQGFSGITIQNGTIQQFQNGIDFGGYRPEAAETPSSSHTVRDVRITGTRGIHAWDVTALTIERSEIRSIQAVLLSGTFGGQHAVIRGNVIDGDVYAFYPDSVVDRNRVEDGRILSGGHRNRITRNRVLGGSDAGMSFSGDDVVVSRNVVTGHSAGLIGYGNGIVERNDFSGNSGDGIRIELGRPVLLRNTTSDNGHDGIEVLTAGTVVGHNQADQNGRFGIVAAAGVVDAGGNRARGNGNAVQCVNVACK